jgi:hypothetical protein
MRTLLGAIAGALAVVVVLVSYDLGERRAFSRDSMMPTTQMVMGPDGVARPYLASAGQAAYSMMTSGAGTPYGYSGYSQPVYQSAQPQYATEGFAVERPVVRRASTQRVVTETAPRRSWQKSALLIGGSAGAGAGVGALIGGKKGALAGAAIGGGTAAIYDQVKRH